MDINFLRTCLADGMSTRDIEKLCDKKRSTISYWINKYNLKEDMKYKKTDKYSFEKIDNKEKAYALGFILADSGINRNNLVEISVSIEDSIVCEFIANVINGKVMYDYTYDKKSRRFPRARLIKKIPDIVKFTGGEKKENRHFPRISKDLERYLLQGFFDADGCITWGYRKDRNRIWQKVSFTSQRKLLEGVQKYLYKTLGISTVLRPKGNEKCFVLEIANRNDVLNFCNYIYPDENFLVLNRKYLKYNALRLELEENGEMAGVPQYRAELAEQEGVETNGDLATNLNNHNSIQDYIK